MIFMSVLIVQGDSAHFVRPAMLASHALSLSIKAWTGLHYVPGNEQPQNNLTAAQGVACNAGPLATRGAGSSLSTRDCNRQIRTRPKANTI